jgi:hypothetical protein
MRGVRCDFGPSRIKGKRSLIARLRRLTLADYRFGVHRAASHEDRQFAGRLFDGLRQTLDAIERGEERLGDRGAVSRSRASIAESVPASENPLYELGNPAGQPGTMRGSGRHDDGIR